MGDRHEFNFAAARAKAFAGELREGEDEIGDGVGAEIEEVEVEVEGLAGSECLTVEVGGAEDKRARPIGETAGSGTSGGGFKHPGVGTLGAHFASGRRLALREASDMAEDSAECAAQNVGRFAFGEVDGVAREEGEPQGMQLDEQRVSLARASKLRFQP